MTVFERLREARTADEVRQVQASALAERPFAPMRELAALRRGVRERLVQVKTFPSDTERLAPGRTQSMAPKARFGARLSAAPRLKGARRSSAAAKAGGGFGSLVLGFVLLRLLSPDASSSKPTSVTHLPARRIEIKGTPGSLANVPGWDAARTEIDALRLDATRNRERLRAIAARLKLTSSLIRMILTVSSTQIDGPDRNRLRALEAALESPSGAEGMR